MKQFTTISILLFSTIHLNAQTIIPTGQSETGTGARAFALANNHVALSTGVADLLWNPGALSFSVSREFQMSLYGLKLNSKSLYEKRTTTDDIQRFRIGSLGFSIALPTSRGGLSIAGSFSNPVILDDAFQFSGVSYYNGTTTDLIRMYRITGNLNYWSAGFGMQVAPNFGIGITASLVTGKGTGEWYLDKFVFNPSDTIYYYDDFTMEGRYVGYDLRAGLFYKNKIINAGARMVVPQAIRYLDYANGPFTKKNGNETYLDGTDKYTMYAPYKGALGASLTLPFFTVSSEVRLTLPFDYLFPLEKIPTRSQASTFKSGAGIGVEVPLILAPVIFRAGYSYDDLDLHPYAYDFVESPKNIKDFEWMDIYQTVTQNLHRFSAGFGYITESMSFDLSYGLSTWGIKTYDPDMHNYLKQTYLLHRVLASVAVRF